MLLPEEQKKRLSLYNQGLMDREIAERVHVTPNTITSWRKTYGIPAHNKRRITPEIAEEMLRMYRAGESDARIAAKIARSKTMVRAWRHKHNLPPNFAAGREPIPRNDQSAT